MSSRAPFFLTNNEAATALREVGEKPERFIAPGFEDCQHVVPSDLVYVGEVVIRPPYGRERRESLFAASWIVT